MESKATDAKANRAQKLQNTFMAYYCHVRKMQSQKAVSKKDKRLFEAHGVKLDRLGPKDEVAQELVSLGLITLEASKQADSPCWIPTEKADLLLLSEPSRVLKTSHTKS